MWALFSFINASTNPWIIVVGSVFEGGHLELGMRGD
jgi:hypothetical protein